MFRQLQCPISANLASSMSFFSHKLDACRVPLVKPSRRVFTFSSLPWPAGVSCRYFVALINGLVTTPAVTCALPAFLAIVLHSSYTEIFSCPSPQRKPPASLFATKNPPSARTAGGSTTTFSSPSTTPTAKPSAVSTPTRTKPLASQSVSADHQSSSPPASARFPDFCESLAAGALSLRDWRAIKEEVRSGLSIMVVRNLAKVQA